MVGKLEVERRQSTSMDTKMNIVRHSQKCSLCLSLCTPHYGLRISSHIIIAIINHSSVTFGQQVHAFIVDDQDQQLHALQVQFSIPFKPVNPCSVIVHNITI
jgi:hypothetical protein